MSFSLKKSSLNTSSESFASNLLSNRKASDKSKASLSKHKRSEKTSKDLTQSLLNPIDSVSKEPIPRNYCVNIYVDGAQHMDRTSHLNSEQFKDLCLEHQLRPISGLRNHLRRNLSSRQLNFDLIKETDFIDRIGIVLVLSMHDLKYSLKLNKAL
jgi:hypothetical protein